MIAGETRANMPRYLADTSIWAWSVKPQRPDIARKLAERVAGDEVVTCVPVAVEVLHRADTSEKYAQVYNDLLEPLDWLTLTESAGCRAMDVQQLLARKSNGAHRRPAIDFLVAAIAEEHDDIIVWAFDNDYGVIASVTNQAVEIETSNGPGGPLRGH